MKVYIAELLCPNRHCLMAMAGEFEGENYTRLEARLQKAMLRAIETNMIKPVCAVCDAPHEVWSIETKITKYGSLADAEPEMRREEREQFAVAMVCRIFGVKDGQAAMQEIKKEVREMMAELEERKRKARAASNN